MHKLSRRELHMTMTDFDKQLQEILDRNRIFKKEPMSKHTSLKVGGEADYFVKIIDCKRRRY